MFSNNKKIIKSNNKLYFFINYKKYNSIMGCDSRFLEEYSQSVNIFQ
jgi:hypothetical protein